ncbi:MAG: LicD family protein [Clostridia bacterium]|nr:LicD family protein [Clostridia bacterium]
MNNQELTLRDMQQSCLDMLRVFDAFCRENGITYFISGGTMLGAIRHRGFIPWDDDADIMMPRADYEKLLSLNFRHDRYRFYSLKTDPGYARPWARLTDSHTKQIGASLFLGDTTEVCIDIMPIDGLPESDRETEKHFRRLVVLDQLNKCARRDHIPASERIKPLKRLATALLGLKYARKIAIKIDKNAQKWPYEGSAYRGVSVINHYGVREKLKADVFDETIDVDFEDLKLMLFSGYESYLKNIYGDYMQLPPEDKRTMVHATRYRWVEGK